VDSSSSAADVGTKVGVDKPSSSPKSKLCGSAFTKTVGVRVGCVVGNLVGLTVGLLLKTSGGSSSSSLLALSMSVDVLAVSNIASASPILASCWLRVGAYVGFNVVGAVVGTYAVG
jgi:hypothetical protein